MQQQAILVEKVYQYDAIAIDVSLWNVNKTRLPRPLVVPPATSYLLATTTNHTYKSSNLCLKNKAFLRKQSRTLEKAQSLPDWESAPAKVSRSFRADERYILAINGGVTVLLKELVSPKESSKNSKLFGDIRGNFGFILYETSKSHRLRNYDVTFDISPIKKIGQNTELFSWNLTSLYLTSLSAPVD